MLLLDLIVGVGDHAISKRQGDVIKTYALASCVGLTFYCPRTRVAAMLHVVLPDHQVNSNLSNPSYFVSTGVPMLFNRLEKEYGCKREDLIIHLYGGADSVRPSDVFRIGKKNLHTVTNILTDMNIKHAFSDVGGTLSRTIEIDVASGAVKVFKQPITI